MTLDESVLAEVETVRERLERLEDETFAARATFNQSVRRLHTAGGSLREIATALGLSHQRVHQIIGEESIVEVEASATEVSLLPTAVAVTEADDRCSFCGAPRRELNKLLAAPGDMFICASCVERADQVLQRSTPVGGMRPAPTTSSCSFCQNPAGLVGPIAELDDGAARICRRCVAACQKLLGPADPSRVTMRRASVVRCSFCNVSQKETKKLIAGPGIYICENCIAAAGRVAGTSQPVKGERQVTLRPASTEPHNCNFCGKSPVQVKAMVRGGRGRICNECLALCESILAEELA